MYPAIKFLSAPLNLGSPLRTPHFAWPSWGIQYENDEEFKNLLSLSESAYSHEWKETRQVSHEAINHAAKHAGLGGANELLNDCLAEAAARIIHESHNNKFYILDVGAGSGATTHAIWKILSSNDRIRTQWLLLDPATAAMKEAQG